MKTGDNIQYKVIHQGVTHVNQIYVYKVSNNILTLILETEERSIQVGPIGFRDGPLIFLDSINDDLTDWNSTTEIELDLYEWKIFSVSKIGNTDIGLTLERNVE